MATVTWNDSAADGDLSNVANYSTGALPNNGDTFIIAQGVTPIQLGLTALAAITLAVFQVTEGYKGQYIGSDTAAMSISTITSFLFKASPNLVYAKFTAPVTKATVDGTGAGQFIVAGNTWALLQACSQGVIQIATDSTVTALTTGGNVRAFARPKGSGAGFTTLEIGAGSLLETERDVVNGGTALCDGTLVFKSTATLAGTSVLTLTSRGVALLKSLGVTYNKIKAFAGSKVDPTGMTRDSILSTLIRHRGANVIRKSGGVGLTITTEEVLGGDDPLFLK